jgi:hypothetical protein
VKIVLVDAVRLGHGLQDSYCGNGGIFRFFHFRKQHDEFIASLTADGVQSAHAIQKALGDGLKKLVANGMTEGSERTHEIGIRIALSAERSSILRVVLRQGLGLAVAGAAVGLVGALIVSHLMGRLLYGVRPTDPITFLSVGLLLIGVALLACYIPVLRALRIDPLVALRHE